MPRFQPRRVERSMRISSHCALLFAVQRVGGGGVNGPHSPVIEAKGAAGFVLVTTQTGQQLRVGPKRGRRDFGIEFDNAARRAYCAALNYGVLAVDLHDGGSGRGKRPYPKSGMTRSPGALS
jgi:hypothetical protein